MGRAGYWYDLSRGRESPPRLSPIPESGRMPAGPVSRPLAEIRSIQRAGADRPCACDRRRAGMDCPQAPIQREAVAAIEKSRRQGHL